MTTNLVVGIVGLAITGIAIANLVLLRRRTLRAAPPLPRRSARIAATGLGVSLAIGIVFISIALLAR